MLTSYSAARAIRDWWRSSVALKLLRRYQGRVTRRNIKQYQCAHLHAEAPYCTQVSYQERKAMMGTYVCLTLTKAMLRRVRTLLKQRHAQYPELEWLLADDYDAVWPTKFHALSFMRMYLMVFNTNIELPYLDTVVQEQELLKMARSTLSAWGSVLRQLSARPLSSLDRALVVPMFTHLRVYQDSFPTWVTARRSIFVGVLQRYLFNQLSTPNFDANACAEARRLLLKHGGANAVGPVHAALRIVNGTFTP